jgi:hypothetical protein
MICELQNGRYHSYITLALLGGEGGVRNLQFLLIFITKIKLMYLEGRGLKKPKNVLTLYMNGPEVDSRSKIPGCWKNPGKF